MAPTTKKTSRSISFTPAEADQALLEAIDHELAEQRYSSFSELCKEALRQLLLASQSEQPPLQLAELQQQLTRLEQALATKELPQFERFEDQLADLTRQLDQVNANVNQVLQPSPQLDQITTHLSRLSTQIEQVVSQSNLTFVDLESQITKLGQTLSAKEASQFSEFERLLTRLGLIFEQLEAKSRPPSKPEPAEIISETADPVLSRLSRVLESF